MCTQCALSALGRRRVLSFVKWSLPPSGRVRLSAAGLIFRQQHNWLAAESLDIRICTRVTCLLCFPLCHRYCKANRVAIGVVLFANWCFLEYMVFVEVLDIISRFLLGAHCIQGFRLYVSPLYSTVSLMEA